ncbi:Elongation factor 1-delta [Merluccius polli]|uniref:Elongation factor 1-delta n=1 Tax=Merluccius polli TaxID=89951 RepID=A0AA47P188_MERPO|nr:Elongation factor 1-delta [Merluccius polli]
MGPYSYGALARQATTPTLKALVEEEEEDDDGGGGVEVRMRRREDNQVGSRSRARLEVFHALHPIQEEERAGGGSARSKRTSADGRPLLNAPRQREGVARPSVRSTQPRAVSIVSMWAQQCRIWFEKPRYDEAERRFFERESQPSEETQVARGSSPILTSGPCHPGSAGSNSILQGHRKSKGRTSRSLWAGTTGTGAGDQGEFVSRMKSLELENQSLHKVVEDLRSALSKLGRVEWQFWRSSGCSRACCPLHKWNRT